MLSTDCMWDYFHQKERNQKVPKLLTYKVTYNVIWNVTCTHRVRGGIAVTYLMFSQTFATGLFCNNKRIVPCTNMHILCRKSRVFFIIIFFFCFHVTKNRWLRSYWHCPKKIQCHLKPMLVFPFTVQEEKYNCQGWAIFFLAPEQNTYNLFIKCRAK